MAFAVGVIVFMCGPGMGRDAVALEATAAEGVGAPASPSGLEDSGPENSGPLDPGLQDAPVAKPSKGAVPPWWLSLFGPALFGPAPEQGVPGRWGVDQGSADQWSADQWSAGPTRVLPSFADPGQGRVLVRPEVPGRDTPAAARERDAWFRALVRAGVFAPRGGADAVSPN